MKSVKLILGIITFLNVFISISQKNTIALKSSEKVISKKTINKTVNLNKENKTVLKPTNHAGKVLIISNKKYLYYAFAKNKKMQLKVKGPGKIDVMLRMRLKDSADISKNFSLQYIIDGSKSKIKKIPTRKASLKSKYKKSSNGLPSKAYRFKISIPPGTHILDLKKLKTNEKVHSHFTFNSLPEPIWKTYYPFEKLEEIAIKYIDKKGEIKKYYRISDKSPFKLKSLDTMSIKVVVKAELGNTVQSNTPLHLILKTNGKIKRTYKISGYKSRKTEYVSEGKLIPGKTNVFYLKIPKGVNNYEFLVAEKNTTALIQIYFDSKITSKS